MAGRGRGATLPAWMTAAGADAMNGNGGSYPSAAPASYNPAPASYNPPPASYNPPPASYNPPPASYNPPAAAGRYDDYSQPASHHAPSSYSAPQAAPAHSYAPPAQQYGSSAPPAEQYQPRASSHSDRRSTDRDSGRERHSNSSSQGTRVPGSWKRGGTRVSNFDVRPPDGVELPPIGVSSTSSGVPNSYFSYANNPALYGAPLPGTGTQGVSKYGVPSAPANQPIQVDPNMATRHARRIYAGGIPPRVTEIEIANFFNDVVTRALAPARPDGPPVVKVYLNTEKCYAFVEFSSIELCTACMALDGIRFEHYTGTTIVRIRRPNDYRPELLPPSNAPIPTLNLAAVGITGVSSGTMGPGKIFIGGLPYNLTDEQVMELMSAFGPIKAFHQVRDPGSVTTKGYGFCEYVNLAHGEAAIAGLNGMQLGDKTLTVRFASQGGSSGGQQQQQQQQSLLLGGLAAGLGINTGLPGAAPHQHGVGAAAGGIYGPGPGAPGGAGLAGPPPSRVLRLSNMVTRDDLYNEAEYQDIREDVRLECQQYGKVNNVVIPRASDGYSPSAEGLIFVEFDSVQSARSAAAVLNGRKFADKTVVVGFFDEQEFVSQRLI